MPENILLSSSSAFFSESPINSFLLLQSLNYFIKGLSLMKLLDSPGFWMGVDRCGGNKTQTTKMKEKKKTKQEQALKADLHVALCS